ncbi:MAG: hypothetical protein JWN95_1123 [Frankiales bacterium]|nr:hypothetical protein [Frankiales bacterium]
MTGPRQLDGSRRLEDFLAFSAEATAFTVFELRGTGQSQAYLNTCDGIVGTEVTDCLLDRYDAARSAVVASESTLPELLRRDILSDPQLGPVARNIAKMWFVGVWYELPRAWTEAFGAREGNATFVVSTQSYTEGLLWPAIGANPPGAKAPGFGSWAHPPRIPVFP